MAAEDASRPLVPRGGGSRFALGGVRRYAEARYGLASEGDGDVKFVPLTVGITC